MNQEKLLAQRQWIRDQLANVADFVLAQHAQVQFMSITQLADECGTAEATVSRFCRSLKLKGFNAFKIELARLSAPGAGARSRSVSTDTLAGRVQELGRLSIDAVHQTMELMDLHQIERAVEMIEKASRVLCIGSGGKAGGCGSALRFQRRPFPVRLRSGEGGPAGADGRGVPGILQAQPGRL